MVVATDVAVSNMMSVAERCLMCLGVSVWGERVVSGQETLLASLLFVHMRLELDKGKKLCAVERLSHHLDCAYCVIKASA